MSVDAKMEAYLKKYCVKHNCTPEEAEKHAVVKSVRDVYEKKDSGWYRGIYG